MFLDKICTVLIVLYINILLFRKYANGYTKLSLIPILLSVCSFSLYAYAVVKEIKLYWYIQIIIIVFMVLIPFITYLFTKKSKVQNSGNVLSKAKKCILDKDTSGARKYIAKYLENEKEDSNIYLLLGMCDKIDKKEESAIANFMKAVESDTSNYMAYYELGKIMERAGKIDTAIVMLTNANKLKPDFYDAAELLGICYTSQRKYSDAENVYKNALKYHENSYELNYNLAIIYLEKGYIDEAEECLIKAVNLTDEPYGACYSLGNIYYNRSKYQNALENYKIARLDESLTASSLYKMSIIYSRLREFESAVICLEYSILLDEKYIKQAKTEISFEKIITEVTVFIEKISNSNYSLKKDKIKSKVINKVMENNFMDKIDINDILNV